MLQRIGKTVAWALATLVFSQTAQAAEHSLLVGLTSESRLSGAQLAERVTALTGYSVVQFRPLAQPGAWRMIVDAPLEQAESLLQSIKRMVDVRKVHPDFTLRPMAGPPVRPDDPLFSTMQASYMDGNAYASLRMPSVWSVARGSARVVVAVLDSGALYAHPELKGRLLQGYDFVSSVSAPSGPTAQSIPGGSNDGDGRDPDAADPGDAGPAGSCSSFGSPESTFHGTAVASVIAANTDNGEGMAGMNGAARILPLRISGQCGQALASDILDAMYWAIGDPVPGLPLNPEPARVLNLSFAGGLALTPCTDSLFEDAIARVRQRGAIFVAAAGNSGTALEFPASCVGAVAVGAVTPDGRKVGYSAYSGRGERAAVLMAPSDSAGFYVVAGNTQFPDGRPNPSGHTTIQKAGTSFATPLVSGLIALLLQTRPDWTADQAVSALRSTARAFPAANPLAQCPPPQAAPPAIGIIDNPCACTTTRCGDGIVAPLAALEQARAGLPVANVPFAKALDRPMPVALDGSASSAASANALQYRWTQIGGFSAQLAGTDTAVLQVTPANGASGSGRFELRVTDPATGRQHAAQTLVLLPGGSGLPAGNTSGTPEPPLSGPPVSGNETGTGGGGASVSASPGGGGGGALGAAWPLLLAGVLLLRRTGQKQR